VFHLHPLFSVHEIIPRMSLDMTFSGTLEGKRERPGFRELIDDPLLRFSGICQESSSDLYVTCQVFADGRKLVLPVQTSYKAFSKRWKFVH